jgi:hopene-associated glycosyltransferase HpnB
MVAETAVAAASLAGWLGALLHPARPWDLRPRDDESPESPAPDAWPSVCILVPARNEGSVLPHTLPSLLAQDYPGLWRVVIVDDRSADDTAAVAASHASERLDVVHGAQLPDGWVGKVWALRQGLDRAGDAVYLLLTDADIAHAALSLRRLVAQSESLGLALNSRMARLRSERAIECLLVPPFVFFFALLYPMRWANDRRRRLAAAAGGCVLVRRNALEAIGGFESLSGAVIDDVSLARRVKAAGLAIRLETGSFVRSVRSYGTLSAFWRTVRRTAFTQLRHSVLLLVATLVALLVLFAAPPLLVALGGAGVIGWLPAVLGGMAWLVSSVVYVTTLRRYGLRLAWAVTLPLAGLVYGGMTVDSALRYARGERRQW